MYTRWWLVHVTMKGFDCPIFIKGTEEEMQAYTESEFGYVPAYSGATDKEVEAGVQLRMKFYLASTL